ncbi:hypothetical protein BaRGS_00002959 [Batillaria attramentaria]|uniref:XK-related protein n=1 Tax=Batillaria attramentaria TaxID=370345 RepID=A0ABD0M1Y0_9CAEN
MAEGIDFMNETRETNCVSKTAQSHSVVDAGVGNTKHAPATRKHLGTRDKGNGFKITGHSTVRREKDSTEISNRSPNKETDSTQTSLHTHSNENGLSRTSHTATTTVVVTVNENSKHTFGIPNKETEPTATEKASVISSTEKEPTGNLPSTTSEKGGPKHTSQSSLANNGISFSKLSKEKGLEEKTAITRSDGNVPEQVLQSCLTPNGTSPSEEKGLEEKALSTCTVTVENVPELVLQSCLIPSGTSPSKEKGLKEKTASTRSDGNVPEQVLQSCLVPNGTSPNEEKAPSTCSVTVENVLELVLQSCLIPSGTSPSKEKGLKEKTASTRSDGNVPEQVLQSCLIPSGTSPTKGKGLAEKAPSTCSDDNVPENILPSKEKTASTRSDDNVPEQVLQSCLIPSGTSPSKEGNELKVKDLSPSTLSDETDPKQASEKEDDSQKTPLSTFTVFDASVAIVLTFFWTLGVLGDTEVAISHFIDEEWLCGCMIGSLLIVSYLIVAFIGVYAYNDNRDVGKCWWVCRVVFLILDLSPIIMTAEYVHYGWMIRTRVDKMAVYEKTAFNRAAQRFFQCFLSAGPNFCSHLYIIFDYKPNDNVLGAIARATAVISSWASLALSAMTYFKLLHGIRKLNTDQMKVMSQIIIFLWRLLETGGRALCIALFASRIRNCMVTSHYAKLALDRVKGNYLVYLSARGVSKGQSVEVKVTPDTLWRPCRKIPESVRRPATVTDSPAEITLILELLKLTDTFEELLQYKRPQLKAQK